MTAITPSMTSSLHEQIKCLERDPGNEYESKEEKSTFALMVFLSDGLLEIKKKHLTAAADANEVTLTAAVEVEENTLTGAGGTVKTRRERRAGAARFLQISRRLPMELQMVLCHVCAGSGKTVIVQSDSEAAFRELVRRMADPRPVKILTSPFLSFP